MKLFVNKKVNKIIAHKVVCKLLVVVLLGEVGEADVEDLVHEDLDCLCPSLVEPSKAALVKALCSKLLLSEWIV